MHDPAADGGQGDRHVAQRGTGLGRVGADGQRVGVEQDQVAG